MPAITSGDRLREYKPRGSKEYAVILYHGIHGPDVDLAGRNSSGKHISVSEFRKHMEIVANEWNLVTMSDIRLAHQGEIELPERAVAITVDDGFSNVYHQAWPILKDLGLKATFYLATGFIGTGRMSWTDQLESMLLDSSLKNLNVKASGQNKEFDLSNVDSKVATLQDIKSVYKRLPFKDVEQLLEDVKNQLDCGPDSTHQLYEMLNWDQVREMNEEGTFDFGAHTVDHIPVSRIPYEEMKYQVSASLEKVSDELDSEIRVFSYPEGQSDDYDQPSIDYLKSIGVDMCPTAIEGVNNYKKTDPFHISRCMIGFEGRSFVLD